MTRKRAADSKPKDVVFLGRSLDDLRDFPRDACREAGETVGAGAKEIRIRDADGVYRVVYVAKYRNAVFVLHCFQKKTEKTSKADVELAAKRYNELVKEQKSS